MYASAIRRVAVIYIHIDRYRRNHHQLSSGYPEQIYARGSYLCEALRGRRGAGARGMGGRTTTAESPRARSFASSSRKQTFAIELNSFFRPAADLSSMYTHTHTHTHTVMPTRVYYCTHTYIYIYFYCNRRVLARSSPSRAVFL